MKRLAALILALILLNASFGSAPVVGEVPSICVQMPAFDVGWHLYFYLVYSVL